MPRLDREEYIEQAYVFNGLNNRLDQSDPVQIVLKHLRDEVLSTTKLPMAIDFLLAELMHVGTMGTATPVVCSAKTIVIEATCWKRFWKTCRRNLRSTKKKSNDQK